MAYKIFISHAAKDVDLARDLARRLKETGGEVFLDKENLTAGTSIAEKIEQGLKNSDEVIILLTEHSVASRWVMMEVGAAYSLRKRITPVLVGSPEIPPMLQTLQPVKYSELPRYISDLQHRIQPVEQVRRTPESSIKGVKNARAATRR